MAYGGSLGGEKTSHTSEGASILLKCMQVVSFVV